MRDRVAVTTFVLLLAGALAIVTGIPAASQQDLLDRGRELYEVGCVSCHGLDGGGVVAPDGSLRGPSLATTGEAGAYYYLATGRMPLADSRDEAVRKRPAYDPDEIEALTAYVASLGSGPPLPTVDPTDGDLARGGELFRANCAPCHSAAGAGGALSYGGAAPSLDAAEPPEVAAAVRAGPGQMPVFDLDVLDGDDLDDLTRHVQYLQDPDDPGGLPIGRTGPVPEGFVAWFFGIGALLAATAWIGTRAPAHRRRDR